MSDTTTKKTSRMRALNDGTYSLLKRMDPVYRIIFVLFVLILFNGIFGASHYIRGLLVFNLLTTCWFLFWIGRQVTDKRYGILIADSGRFSLSRMQATAWTVVVLSALLTAAVANLSIPDVASCALAIVIPPELLAAMGISYFTTCAVPCLLSVKDPANVATERDFDDETDAGKRFADMFRGDEKSNHATVDMTKVQQAFLTAIILLVYVCGLLAAFHTELPIFGLPGIRTEVVQLMAFSHAGYLVYKGVPKPDLPADTKKDKGTSATLPNPTLAPAVTGAAPGSPIQPPK